MNILGIAAGASRIGVRIDIGTGQAANTHEIGVDPTLRGVILGAVVGHSVIRIVGDHLLGDGFVLGRQAGRVSLAPRKWRTG